MGSNARAVGKNRSLKQRFGHLERFAEVDRCKLCRQLMGWTREATLVARIMIPLYVSHLLRLICNKRLASSSTSRVTRQGAHLRDRLESQPR